MMSSLPSKANNQIRYSMAQLIQLRRQMLRFARSLPPGQERNERRQIAASLRSLFSNKAWLDDYAINGSDYRVYAVAGTDSHFLKAIKLDPPDDAAAIESAKQFIDGHDIELWHLGRRIAAFERKPE
jgi:hypothetical protein